MHPTAVLTVGAKLGPKPIRRLVLDEIYVVMKIVLNGIYVVSNAGACLLH